MGLLYFYLYLLSEREEQKKTLKKWAACGWIRRRCSWEDGLKGGEARSESR
jgi:hypothetical protein